MPGQTIARHQIHDYGANLNADDAESVLRSMVCRDLVTKSGDGDFRIAPTARQAILEEPSLNWAQEHHEQLKGVTNPCCPRSLEEYTALDVLASNDTDDDLRFAGRKIQAEICAKGIDFSDRCRRSLMQWLVENDYVSQGNKPDAYVLTPQGAAKAKTTLTEFEGASFGVVDRVKGREEAGLYGLANIASFKLRQKRIHEIEHQHYSRILQEVKEGYRAPGDSFPVSTNAAAAQGISYHELYKFSQRLERWGILEKQGSGEFKIHQNAQNVIAGNQEFIWRANNATRLQKTADTPQMPGTWAQQQGDCIKFLARFDCQACPFVV